MKMNEKRVFAFLLALLLLLTGTMTAYAVESIDVDHKTNLTLQYHYEDIVIPNATFKIYRVASVTSGVHFNVLSPFDSYPLDFNVEEAEEWNEIANTLRDYVSDGKVKETASGKTDKDGKYLFGDLSTGLYLVIGDKTTYDGYVYTPSPAVVLLPGLDPVTENSWLYDVTISPKVTREKAQEPPVTTVSRKVLKVWQDEGYTAKRPTEVTIKLMKNGKSYESVKLNEKNSWKYEWNNLPEYDTNGSKNEWSVLEESVSGYTVSIKQEGNAFTVTNTYKPVTPREPSKPEPKDPELPQTGVLWWPVPALLAAGVVCVAFGVVRRKENNE